MGLAETLQFRDDLLQEEDGLLLCTEQQQLGGKAESYLPLSCTIFV